MSLRAIITVTILFGALLGGLFAGRESGVLHQLSCCDQYVSELTGRLETLTGSSTFRIISQHLPGRTDFEEDTVASSPFGVLRRMVSFCPGIGTFLKSTKDLQRCELVARNLEKELEYVESKLGVSLILKYLLNEKPGNICLFALICCQTLGGILLLMSELYNKKQEFDSDEEDDDYEIEWSSLDSSLDETEDTDEPENTEKLLAMEKLLEQERLIFEKTKAEMESEIRRLAAEIEVTQKDREHEALQRQRAEEGKESTAKTVIDLQEMNDQLLRKIADKEASLKQHRNQTDEMEHSLRLLKEDLDRAQEQHQAQNEIQYQLKREKEELQNIVKQQAGVIEGLSENEQRLKNELKEIMEHIASEGKINRKELEEIKEDKEIEKQKAEKDIVTVKAREKVTERKEDELVHKEDDHKDIVTVKDRVKDKERKEDKLVHKEEDHKADEGCLKPQEAKKPPRKLIVFDLEPDEPEKERSLLRLSKLPPQYGPRRQDQEDNSITFMGQEIQLHWLEDTKELAVELDIPRKFHRAINGVQGRTLVEITRKSGVTLIDMPGRLELSDLITIVGKEQQIRLAARQIESLVSKLY